MLLVVDSSAALRAGLSSQAAAELRGHELIGPPLLWSEVHSAVHEATWRGELDREGAGRALAGFSGLGIGRRMPPGLYEHACELADALGWAKTYDAEFLALARLERAVVLTTDARMRRRAGGTGLVIHPGEL